MFDNFPTFSEGRYRIESRLGEGGMAAVFRAWDTRLHVYRAIKCLDPNLSSHPQIRQRFEVEARTMASMNHPNIVAVQDIGHIGSRLFIIMELLTGGSLWDRVHDHGVLHPQYAIDAAIAMAKGLGAAHSCNIVHRDVKPHNVLVSKEGVLKLTDFGIARIEGGNNRTRTGVLMGTLNYMAPEQRLSASRATPISDLYAVGASLYSILIGKSNENLFDAEEQKTAFADLHDDLAAFLRKACHQDPSQRHENAEQMIEELMVLKTKLVPAPETAKPLFIPFESREFDKKPTPGELTDLHTSWSQYGSESGADNATASNSTTMNLFDEPVDSAGSQTSQLSSSQASAPPQPEKTEKPSSSASMWALLAVVVVAILGVVYWQMESPPAEPPPSKQASASSQPASQPPSTESKPELGLSLSTIAIVPFSAQSDNPKVNILSAGIFQDISSGLSQSVAKLSILPLKASPDNLGAEARRIKAGYIIEGNLQSFNDSLRLNIKLLDSAKMSIVWSKTFKRNLSSSDVFVIQDEIVGEIVDALVGNGFIMAEDVQRKAISKGAKDLSVYECRNFAYQFYKTYLPADYEKVNTCLRKSIKVDPNYAELYYHLAHINFVAWQMGYKEDKALILEAIEFADKCVALDPSNPQGHFGKGLLSFVMQDWESMHKALQKAVEMAPNNVEILSNAGLISITGGGCSLEQYRDRKGKLSSYTTGVCRWKPGMEMLQKAFELDKGNLYPVKNYGIAHVYNLWGEYEKAYNQMQLAASPGMLWYEMHSAIAAAGLQDKKLATKHFDAAKKTIGSNKLNDAHAHFIRWHIPQYWDMSKDFLVQYGFE